MKKTFFTHTLSLLVIIMALLTTLIPVKNNPWGIEDCALLCVVPTIIAINVCLAIHTKQKYEICTIDILLTSWYLYVVIYAFVYPQYPIASTIARTTVLLGLYYALKYILHIHKYNRDIIVLLIISICAIECFIAIYQSITGESRNNLYCMTGTLFNPGPLGIMLAVGTTLYIGIIKKYRQNISQSKYKNYIIPTIILSLGLMFTVLLITGSRTAICALILYLICDNRQTLGKYALYITIFLLILIPSIYLFKQNSADSRGVMWLVSIHNIIQQPFLGSGIGSFMHQYALGMKDISTTLPTTALNHTDVIRYIFNFPLYIGVEQGIVGILFMLGTITIIIKYSLNSKETIKWILPILFFTSIFSYTLEMLPLQIIGVISLATISADNDTDKKIIRTSATKILLPLLIPYIALFGITRKRVKANMEYTKIQGTYTNFYINRYYELLPYMYDNQDFLFNFAKIFSAKQRYNDSNAILKKGELISSDPMFYIIQANNYQSLKEYSLAEKYYRLAFLIMPNRIYPLYKLMLLYKESGQIRKARQMALKVLTFNVKIESEATKHMKKQATTVIQDGPIH